MSMYRICSLGDGIGFKVQVTDGSGGLRVVGVFADEAVAKAWIIADQQEAGRDSAEDRQSPHWR
ncbi:MAG: hypothetical protein ACJ8AW_48760 [Rhodopila sp.]